MPQPVIGVPVSVGYGVSAGGMAALHGMLASCAPGLTVVNIDNGYGAAMAALRILQGRGPAGLRGVAAADRR
jgi:NCAIR mutase (PurE)-related protein